MLTIYTHGEIWFKNDKDKGKRPFTQVVKAPNLEFFHETHDKYTGTDDKGEPKFVTRDILNVRGRLKKQLLPLLLAKTHPDFVRVAVVIIDSIETDKGKELDGLPVQLQSRKQLKAHCVDNKIPILADEYLSIDELRSDILAYTEDPKSFLRNKERKNSRRRADNEFMRLNGLLDENTGAKGIAGL